MHLRDTILTSIEPVITNSYYVITNIHNLEKFAEKLINLSLPAWDNQLQYQGSVEDTLQYYFFVDSINFCFWALKGNAKWAYEHEGKWLTGYYAYSYAIKKAIEKNEKLLDASYLSEIPYEAFIAIFQGKGDLLLLKERHNIIEKTSLF